MGLSFIYKVCRTGPEHSSRKNLVSYSEIAPSCREIHLAEEESHHKDRKRHQQALHYRLLVTLQQIGERKAETSECSVSRSYRTDHNSKDSDYSAGLSEPALAYHIHDIRCLGVLYKDAIDHRTCISHCSIESLRSSEIGYCCSSPYHRDDTLGDHGTVEHRTGIFLILQAACHHRRLGRMESGNRAA